MLIDKYRQIFDTPDLWKYYPHLNFENNPFDSESVAESFIYNYFQKGNKESVIDSKIPPDKARDNHSISTFFLGLLIKPLLEIPSLEPDFRYLWFIACLYHDYGYHIEKDRKNYLPKNITLDTIIQELDIKYNLLESKSNSLFDINTVKKYYNYCRKKDPSFLNHGIIGGLLLYDRLKKNFDENLKQAKNENPNVNSENFHYRGLHWSSFHDDYYKKVANSIVSHNIWFANKAEVIENYKKHKLDKLIIENSSQRLKCESNPFLFLLLLSDTIEPIKFFTQYQSKCILNKINIEVLSGLKKISITTNDLCMDCHNWFDKIKDMENWLDLTVKDIDNGLTIEIK